jgi:peptidyl-tRNA hydrolase, PTH2 family
MNTKMIIVMRKDLNMRKGKMIAQGCHAGLKIFFDRIKTIKPEGISPSSLLEISVTPEMLEWVQGLYGKICVSVNSEAELLEIDQKAKEAGLPVTLIEDAGLTEFKGIPTKTCLAIGPDDSEKIDKITGHLPLL